MVQKPVKNFNMFEATEENVMQFAIADRNMNIIRNNIDGGVSSSSILAPEYTNGAFIIQTGSTQWVSGTAYSSCNGTFRPYRTISREEAAAMLNRLYTALGGTVDTVSGETYADDAQIDDWARDSVYAMREKNIMTGKQDNKFCPKDGYTAEQAVVTMERMYQAER